jgi:hypothetical protein
MHDIAVVVVLLSACTAIGLPLCLILPEKRFEARFVIAPPIGFGLFAIGGTVLYLWGVRPWISMVMMAVAGFVLGAAFLLRTRPLRLAPPSKPTMALGAGTVAVVLICLLPAWTGGPQFRIFQANVYDQMIYLGGSVTFRTLDYASMTAEAKRAERDPVVARSALLLDNRGAVSIVHVAVAGISQHDLIDSSYPFMVAMQVNILFAALFVLINVFSAGYRLSFFLASALTIGFFQQNVFDINAWSELSAQPLYLLIVAFTVLAFDYRRFETGGSFGTVRVGAIFGALLGAVLYLYPEALSIYGIAAAAVLLLAIGRRTSRSTALFGLAGLGLGACVAVLLCVLFWTGTLEYMFRQLGHAAGNPPDWWKYFSRYLFGSEEDYLAVLTDPGSSYGQIAAAWFSLPVESVIAGLGLYFLLPTASWPIVLAFVWKIVLYCFLAVLTKGIAGGVARIWRADPAGNAARMTGACIAGCIVPFVILSMGHYWAAGKGLSMAAPLLFLLVTTPLLAKPDVVNMGLVGRLASLTFAFAHLALGLLRPILVTEFAGAGLPGLPTAAAQMSNQKAEMDWNYQRWATEIRKCNGIIIEVDNPFIQQLVRRVAIDLGVPWASAGIPWPRRSDRSWLPYFPEGWEDFDCVVSASSITAKPGLKLIWVSKDRSIFEYLEGQLAVLEIGAKFVSGVSSRGVYGVESYNEGTLRWTSQVAHFEAPNNPAAPSRSLRLELWPMPLSGDTLKITVNGDTVYHGAIPPKAVSMSLDGFLAQDKLTIELLASAVTHYPNDPRELGVAIKELRLSKSINPPH